MFDKSFCEEQTINASDTYTKEWTIPNGKRWTVTRFGGSCRESAQALNIALRFGTELIRKANMAGATCDLEMAKEFIGDGTKKIKVIMRNNSASQIKAIYWVDMKEMQ